MVFYDVLFDIPNPDRQLDIQMTAQVFIVLAQAKDVLLIPAAAIGNATQGSQITVQVLKPDGSIEARVDQDRHQERDLGGGHRRVSRRRNRW